MLKIKNLDLYYGELQALDNITLDVRKGEILVIIGGNGAGKTSLIRTISGIYKPSKGTIHYKDQDITQAEPYHTCQLGIGHIAEGRQVFPTLSILENLEVSAMLPKARPNLRKNLTHVFHLFPRLKDRQKQLAGTLSGGEQQMLAIGRCLMAQPDLILFDEPSLGLAPVIFQEVFKIIQKLNQQGLTILLVEQNVTASLKIAHRGYVLENGRVCLSGRSEELLNNPQVKEAYLGI